VQADCRGLPDVSMRVLTVLLLASVSFAPVNLLSTRTDPRTGKHTFTATQVTWATRTRRCLTSLRRSR